MFAVHVCMYKVPVSYHYSRRHLNIREGNAFCCVEDE